MIEFGDHPDPNTGTPRVLEPAQPWPIDVVPLESAVVDATDRLTTIYDMRHGAASLNASLQLEETNVRVLESSPRGARVLIRMESSPTAVEAFVPINGTAVIGSDSVDEHHAYVAVSLLDDDTANRSSEVFSPREPGVKAPIKLSGAAPVATANAIEHHLKGVIVETEIDESGNVVAAHAILGRYRSEADQAAIENTVRTWKFKPGTRNGKSVRVLTNVAAEYGR